MNILIIGNGFDIAHGLKTTYKDFLKYCNKTTDDEPEWKKDIRENIWFKHFTSKQTELDNTWIDLETEIYDVVKNIAKGKNTYPSTQTLSENFKINYFSENNKFYRKLNNITFENEPSKLVNYLYSQLRDFTKYFEKYLVETVNNSKLEQYSIPLLSDNTTINRGGCSVISFNYTNTCERLYGKYKIKTFAYIHGKADFNNEDSNLVFGSHSFDRAGSDKDLLYDWNIFQKHNQRHKYGTIDAYQNLLKQIKTTPYEMDDITISVIGHSLDKSDHNILKHIFNIKNSVINIYYHDEKAHEKLINNITDIIGEAEVMSKVRFIYQHDEKHGLFRFAQTTSIG